MMSTDEPTPTTRQAKWEETILFFTSAVGCTLGWTAVLSNLVYYTDTLGVDSYVYLNLCIYAPLFPITIAQALWDADFDRQFTSLKSFWVRGSVGFGVTLLSTICLAAGSERESLWNVSLLSLALGTSSGILHGALKQMASFVYPGCGRLAAAVTAGLQASAVFVLVVSLLNPGSSATSSSHWLHCFYISIAALVGLCWIGFQRLMTHSRDVYRSMLRRDSSIQLSALVEAVSSEEEEPTSDYRQAETENLLNNAVGSSSPEEDELETQTQPLIVSPSNSEEIFHCDNNTNTDNLHSYWQVPPLARHLLRQSWPLCVALFLTVASSMAVSSWFNRVPSTSTSHPDRLPQILFYTRLFSDLFARPATLLLPNNNNPGEGAANQRTLWYLLSIVGIRLFFLPYFFLYVTSSWIPRSDTIMTLGVCAFASSSGFIVTWVYQLAPRYCKVNDTSDPLQATEPDGSLVLQQTNLLNVCFSVSILVGLIGSLSLTSMKLSDTSASS